MDKKRWFALLAAGLLLIFSIGFQLATTVATTDFTQLFNQGDKKFNERVIDAGKGAEKIAVLHLEGVIQGGSEGGLLNTGGYNHQRFLDMLEEAGEDRTVAGIVLQVDTPGGGVVESAEIRDKIKEIQEEYEKPVYISMGNTAASGGYYVSAPADKIVAHPATLTGSIGVIMESMNYAELADKLGIDFNTIKSGEFKDIMSSNREMTDDERAILQTMIDELYDEFVDVIVDGRDLSDKEVRKLGDGRVYTGTQAKENGLVDELGSMDDTIAMMKADYDFKDAQVVEYESKTGISELIGVKVQNMFGSESDLNGMNELLRDSSGPRAMYLYSK